MKLIFRYLRTYMSSVIVVVLIKLLGAFTELMLPYILEQPKLVLLNLLPFVAIALVLFTPLRKLLTKLYCKA